MSQAWEGFNTAEQREFGTEFLGKIVKWIADTFDPEDVFDKEKLFLYIQTFYNPEDVFTKAQLLKCCEGMENEADN